MQFNLCQLLSGVDNLGPEDELVAGGRQFDVGMSRVARVGDGASDIDLALSVGLERHGNEAGIGQFELLDIVKLFARNPAISFVHIDGRGKRQETNLCSEDGDHVRRLRKSSSDKL